MIKSFLFSFFKRWIGWLAGKLLSPKAVTELLLDIARAHVKRGDTTSTGALVDWLEKYLSDEQAHMREQAETAKSLK
ncbi:hypothetical protein L2750_14580 [Shewanella submarina]|uniref:Uncharacterized protein n=1 Tax=Shewanella submarina TaxID=2016376 RepID=A0ABV7G567_9GAMM|nr:hypothetical protein [Shewanella submarina]MCL1038357.1 hypothetical protein [Shewanella submarina]